MIGSMSNIVGLGIDATEVARVARAIERYGQRFLQRVFTEGEIAYCTRRRHAAVHFAGRFAAIGATRSLLTITHTDALAFAEVLLLGT